MYIDSINFAGLRKLNFNYCDKDDNFEKLKFSDINIFIGINGGGKSTVIDIIDSLREPHKIATLQRENWASGSTQPKLTILTRDNKGISFKFLPYVENGGIEEQVIYFYSPFKPLPELHWKKLELNKFDLNKNNIQPLKDFITNQKLDLDINMFNQNIDLQCEDYANELNNFSKCLKSIISKDSSEWKEHMEISCTNQGQLSIYLSDDPKQDNIIPFNMLPSGWISIIKILTWLRKCKDYSICLIEEPETHLHPELQRALIKRMIEIAKHRGLQLFITTHSPTFINTQNNYDDISIFHADGNTINQHVNYSKLFDELGLKGSDILQSNGVIWVEGPSDRLYIKHWLKLWCIENNKEYILEENFDYSFQFYGGKVLTHYTTDEENDLINILKINRNSIIVMDNDNEFKFDNGTPINIKKSIAKTRILNELKVKNKSMIWITKEYTIESYLPDEFLNNYFIIEDNKKLTLNSSKRKVEIAIEYINKTSYLEDKYDLKDKIENIYNLISKWNKFCKFINNTN